MTNNEQKDEMLKKWWPCVYKQVPFENKDVSFSAPAANRRGKFKFLEDRGQVIITPILLILLAQSLEHGRHLGKGRRDWNRRNKGHSFTAGFLEQCFAAWALLMFWARWLFAVGGCPVHCRIFSSVSSLCPLDASGIHLLPSHDQRRLDIAKCPLGVE